MMSVIVVLLVFIIVFCAELRYRSRQEYLRLSAMVDQHYLDLRYMLEAEAHRRFS